MKEIAALTVFPVKSSASLSELMLQREVGEEVKMRRVKSGGREEQVRAVYHLNLKDGSWRIDIVDSRGEKVLTIPLVGRGQAGGEVEERWIDIYI